MAEPTRQEVASKVLGLLSGSLTRREASEWATQWLLGDERVADHMVWNALVLLGAADLISTDRPFLYGEEDYRECLEHLKQSG